MQHGMMPAVCAWCGSIERCQRHQTKVASHTATPLGVAKWLVRGCPEEYSLPLGRRHGLPVPLTCVALVPYLKARFYVWVSLIPAISRCLKARLYGWLPLSNAQRHYSSLRSHAQSAGILFRCVLIPKQSHFLPFHRFDSQWGDKNEKCPGEGIHRTFIVIHLRHCQIVLAG